MGRRRVEAERIDEINILNASFEGMNRAVMSLGVEPQFLAIDGKPFSPPDCPTPYACIVKGRRQVRRT